MLGERKLVMETPTIHAPWAFSRTRSGKQFGETNTSRLPNLESEVLGYTTAKLLDAWRVSRRDQRAAFSSRER